MCDNLVSISGNTFGNGNSGWTATASTESGGQTVAKAFTDQGKLQFRNGVANGDENPTFTIQFESGSSYDLQDFRGEVRASPISTSSEAYINYYKNNAVIYSQVNNYCSSLIFQSVFAHGIKF